MTPNLTTVRCVILSEASGSISSFPQAAPWLPRRHSCLVLGSAQGNVGLESEEATWVQRALSAELELDTVQKRPQGRVIQGSRL